MFSKVVEVKYRTIT